MKRLTVVILAALMFVGLLEGQAGAIPPGVQAFNTAAKATFRLYLEPDRKAPFCTAWYAAPAYIQVDRNGDVIYTSWFITAGHCFDYGFLYRFDGKQWHTTARVVWDTTVGRDVGWGITGDFVRPIYPAGAISSDQLEVGQTLLMVDYGTGILRNQLMTFLGYDIWQVEGSMGIALTYTSNLYILGGSSGAAVFTLDGRLAGINVYGRGYSEAVLIGGATPIENALLVLADFSPEAACKIEDFWGLGKCKE